MFRYRGVIKKRALPRNREDFTIKPYCIYSITNE